MKSADDGARMPRKSKIGLAAVFLLAAGWCAAGNAFAQKKPPSRPVDLNTATVAQLEKVPGIGPSRARAIVNLREKSGAFERVEDLLVIRGINKARLDKMRPYISVEPPAGKSAPRASP